MKSIVKIAAMIVLFSMGGGSAAIASGARTVVVTNNTSYTMTQFYASSSDSSSWNTSSNLFAGQSLAPGQQATIDVSSVEGDDCTYDLMAVLYGATQAAYTYSVNACGAGSWTITGM